MKKIAGFGLAIILLLVASLALRQVLLGGASVVVLVPAPPFVGPISQSLAGAGSKNSLPAYGKDYKLQNIQYFDNSTWVVASITPLNSTLNASVVVLHALSGNYQVVLGPGSAFSSTLVGGFPVDVVQDLNSEGLLYVPN